ncbi:MAG: WhiB family transcriptional regulator [Streptosporangiaceae bacterium]|nr:WhiB family transcriptional regulator [Streptosporangiaceae bacterium]
MPGTHSERELWRILHSGQARCADSGLDPEEWFPLSADVSRARAQAASAIALCTICPVRAECLEFALRQWFGAGGDGVWGGLVAAERRAIRRQWLGGAAVTEFFAEGRRSAS